MTADELRAQLGGVPASELRRRRERFTLVYWVDRRGRSHYPRWQFTADMKVHPDVKRILRTLRTHDTALVLNRFLVPFIGDPPRTALDLIKKGRGAEAMAYVRQSRE